jgi:hypothetical protein
MTQLMKQSLRAVSPSLYRLLRDRYREYAPYNRLVRHIAGGLDWNVESGPFAGMKYLPGFCEGILPKLLGSYEQELWPALHSIASLPIQAVINIGCAEGYYAVGLARLLPAPPSMPSTVCLRRATPPGGQQKSITLPLAFASPAHAIPPPLPRFHSKERWS